MVISETTPVVGHTSVNLLTGQISEKAAISGSKGAHLLTWVAGNVKIPQTN